MIPFGREFYKMSGSGNDFVFVDARDDEAADLAEPAAVSTICARATGIGADGIVFIERSAVADYRIRYLNRDGSLAALCGNASLCGARLAVELGIVPLGNHTLETDAGVLMARVLGDRPEIELAAPMTVQPDGIDIAPAAGEVRVGYAVVGVPHLVVLCKDAGLADVAGRGPMLRSHPSLEDGANVNFVAPEGAGWRIRTFERGVEGETLACGTGAAAAGLLLAAWGLARSEVQLRTRGACVLDVGLPADHPDGRLESRLRLRGAARIVFRGNLGELQRGE